MRAMVVFAHPVPESFSAALHKVVVQRLTEGGWEVDDCDLNLENFQPVLTMQERRDYHDEDINIAPVQDYVDRVRAADALVFVFPVWNFGYPAILKGFFDRVFLPGVSFDLEDGILRGKLHNIRKLAAVTTYGGNRLRAFLAGDPPRKLITRPVRVVMHPNVKVRYLALYDMNRNSRETCGKFLNKVSDEMARF